LLITANNAETKNNLRNTVRNIALFLFGIFSFPLIYQPFHVVVHHGHSHCTRCTVSCSESHSDFGFAIFDVTEEKEEPCPICNYHFPINEIPTQFLSLTKNCNRNQTGIFCPAERIFKKHFFQLNSQSASHLLMFRFLSV
jgi:hypothetical protein